MNLEVPEPDRMPIDATSPTLATDLASILIAYGLARLVPSRFSVLTIRKRESTEVDMIEVTTASPHFLANDMPVKLANPTYDVPASYVITSDDYGMAGPDVFWLPVPYTADSAGGTWERLEDPEE